MSDRKLKTTKWYLFWRVYCVMVCLMLIGFIIGLSNMSEWQHKTGYSIPPVYIPVIILIMFPFFISVFFLIFNLGIFTFNFSIFGPYERSAFPKEESEQEWTVYTFNIGWFHSNGLPVKWYIYKSGIGLSIWPKSKVFIPRENIVELDDCKIIFFHSYTLKHSSPELRNPIIIPNNEIFNALQDIKSR